jgi:hypothetical protein
MANTDEKFRAYFLGELSEEDSARLENDVLGDDAKYALLQAAENDLLDAYANNTLPSTYKKSFEKHYLNSPFRQHRLEFSETLSEYLQNNPKSVQTVTKQQFVWTDIFSFWKIGVAFASLTVLLLSGFWLIKPSYQTPEDEIVLSKTPEPQPTISTNIKPTTSPRVEKTPPKPEINKPVSSTPTPTPKPVISPTPIIEKTPREIKPNETVILVLSAGGLRGNGKTSQITVGKNTKNIVLRLNFGETTAKVFAIKIMNADGEMIRQAKNIRSNGKNVSISLPANLLKNDDYTAEVSTVNATGEEEKIAGFSFRVLQKSN